MSNLNQGVNRSVEATPEIIAEAHKMNEMSRSELIEQALNVENLNNRLAAIEAKINAPKDEEAAVVVRSESLGREWASKVKNNARRIGTAALVAVTVGLGIGTATVGNSTESASAQTGGTPAAAATPSASTEQSNKHNYDLSNKTDTVNEAVEELEFTTARGAFNRILNNPTDYDDLKVSNYKNRQVSLKSFNEKMSTANAAEGIALGIVNSSAKAQDKLNALEGKDGETPRTDTHQEQIAKIAEIVSDEDTKFNGRYRMTGTWDNSFTNNKTKALGSKPATYNNVRALQIVPGDNKYEATYDKIGGGKGDQDTCLNEERRLKSVTTQTSPGKVTFTQPKTPETPKTPTTPKTPETPKTPKTPETPKTPTTPKTPETTTTTTGGKDHTKSPVSSDPNDANEETRPNIATPPVAIQPDGAPATDPYEGPATIPADQDPIIPDEVETTPADNTNNGTATGPQTPVTGE